MNKVNNSLFKSYQADAPFPSERALWTEKAIWTRPAVSGKNI